MHNPTMRIPLNVLTALAIFAPYSIAQTPPALTTLYNFTGGADGGTPYAGLAVSKSGALFGTAYSGGSAFGTVFELTNTAGSWTQTVLHSFTGYPNDGGNSYSNLVMGKGGVLYGTTSTGGGIGAGAVFQLTPPSAAGGTWTETLVYSFGGVLGGHDGANPRAGVVIGANGVLYCTTARGGTQGNGTVFQLTPPTTPGGAWTETVLYRFTNLNGDGANPYGGLVIKHGVLYGTTVAGGSGCGCGVVFKLTPPATTGGAWTETILYSFAGSSDGAYPEAGLVFGSNGALYGTTYQGGPAGLGTVFQLAPPAKGKAWTKTTLYSFTSGTDGAYPFAGLTFGTNGALYSTTLNGGTTGNGTVFELAPPAAAGGTWTESILYNFSGGSDGGAPYGGVAFDKNGVLYGATSAGGTGGHGTVFQLTL
jgi:uncharacterized repeat protein (TIGR03803 family)